MNYTGVDSKKIRKHLSDTEKLSALPTPATVVELPAVVAKDMQHFIARVRVGGAEQYGALLERPERSFVG